MLVQGWKDPGDDYFCGDMVARISVSRIKKWRKSCAT
jgi:hypothetical protein